MTCSLCVWAYPVQDTDFDIKNKHQHLHSAPHKRAVLCAILFHALKSYGELLKDNSFKPSPVEKLNLKFKFPFSDIIFWYLHHDRVWHECKGEEIILEVISLYRQAKQPSQNLLSDLRILIDICRELDLSNQVSSELARKNALKNLVTKELAVEAAEVAVEAKKPAADEAFSAFCDIDLGKECLFQTNFFDSFRPRGPEAKDDKKDIEKPKIDTKSPIEFFVTTLNECDKIQTFSRNPDASPGAQRISSFPTKQWILHSAGQAVQLHGHGVDHIYETCEVEKTSNICERWRHMIFSYALCSLLWNEFNGNKEGPIGCYPQRRNQCLGSIRRHVSASPIRPPPSFKKGDAVKMQRFSGKFSQISQDDIGEIEETFDEAAYMKSYCRVRFGEYSYLCEIDALDKLDKDTQLEHVCVFPPLASSRFLSIVFHSVNRYASKADGAPLNYVGHNIVAFAVGKRGDILRVAYNHNVLFTSTVDHAEERLIDSLYRSPLSTVFRNHKPLLILFTGTRQPSCKRATARF